MLTDHDKDMMMIGRPLTVYPEKPTSSCMRDSVVGFSYVDITVGRGREGWLNLFWGDHCVALVDNAVIADQMRKVISCKPNAGLTLSGECSEPE